MAQPGGCGSGPLLRLHSSWLGLLSPEGLTVTRRFSPKIAPLTWQLAGVLSPLPHELLLMLWQLASSNASDPGVTKMKTQCLFMTCFLTVISAIFYLL